MKNAEKNDLRRLTTLSLSASAFRLEHLKPLRTFKLLSRLIEIFVMKCCRWCCGATYVLTLSLASSYKIQMRSRRRAVCDDDVVKPIRQSRINPTLKCVCPRVLRVTLTHGKRGWPLCQLPPGSTQALPSSKPYLALFLDTIHSIYAHPRLF